MFTARYGLDLHYIIHVKHSPSAFCSYQQDKEATPGNPPKGNAFSDVGEHWIENYFHLAFKVLTTIQNLHDYVTANDDAICSDELEATSNRIGRGLI